MKKSKFTETQIVSILKQADAGVPVKDLCLRQVSVRPRIDVPPVLSSGPIWSPIPPDQEIGREEALFRRADHWLPA